MDSQLKKLIDLAKTTFGLNHYYLQSHEFYRSVNSFNETVYTLSMEWFPNHITVHEDDETNPDGAAYIEINVKSRKFKRANFVGDISYADDGVKFSHLNMEDIIKWIEDKTGLMYGKQFQLKREEKGELTFMACHDGVDVLPPGYIDINFNEEGKLTLFSIHGQFPSKELIKEENYSLSLDQLEDLKMEQLKLIEYFSYEQKRIYPIYVLEEIFVTNDGGATIPFEFFADERYFLTMEQTIFWDEPINEPFQAKEMNWIEDISAEQAFSCEPSPDSFPITREEQEKCIKAVTDFLRQEYPSDSGNWVLKHLYRDKGYIHATLKAVKQEYQVFQRKIKVWIDPRSFQAVNYMDSNLMLKTFDDFQRPDKVTISKEEAFEKMRDLFELKPYYVYDFKQKQYVLCGKLDCKYGVNAANGKVIALGDL